MNCHESSVLPNDIRLSQGANTTHATAPISDVMRISISAMRPVTANLSLSSLLAATSLTNAKFKPNDENWVSVLEAEVNIDDTPMP